MSVGVHVFFNRAVKPSEGKVILALRQGKNLLAGLSTSNTRPVHTLPTRCTSTVFSCSVICWMVLWNEIIYSIPMFSHFVLLLTQPLCRVWFLSNLFLLPYFYYSLFILYFALVSFQTSLISFPKNTPTENPQFGEPQRNNSTEAKKWIAVDGATPKPILSS